MHPLLIIGALVGGFALLKTVQDDKASKHAKRMGDLTPADEVSPPAAVLYYNAETSEGNALRLAFRQFRQEAGTVAVETVSLQEAIQYAKDHDLPYSHMQGEERGYGLVFDGQSIEYLDTASDAWKSQLQSFLAEHSSDTPTIGAVGSTPTAGDLLGL